MPYPLRRLEQRPADFKDLRPGDCWYAPETLEHSADCLSPEYFAKNSHRPPIIVVLPDGRPFVVDSRHCSGGEYGPRGWSVTGDIAGDRVTLHVEPSINAVGSYHGFLQCGVLTDDVDGRAEAHRQRWAAH